MALSVDALAFYAMCFFMKTNFLLTVIRRCLLRSCLSCQWASSSKLDGTFHQSTLLSVGESFLEPLTRDWQHTCTPDACSQFPSELHETVAGASLATTRRQFPCTNPLACTAYTLQGQTLEAMLADFSKPPGMGRAQPSAFSMFFCFAIASVAFTCKIGWMIFLPSFATP